MTDPPAWPAGGSLVLAGTRASLALVPAEPGGVAVITRGDGAPVVLEAADPAARLRLDGPARVWVDLALERLADGVERVSVLAWSERPTRMVTPVSLEVREAGIAVARTDVAPTPGLRAVELVELHRVKGIWRVRLRGEGWAAGADVMAERLALPRAALVPLAPPAEPAHTATAPARSGSRAGRGLAPPPQPAGTPAGSGARAAGTHRAPSGGGATASGAGSAAAAVGGQVGGRRDAARAGPEAAPERLRQALDELVGRGPRGGGAEHLEFALGPVPDARVGLVVRDGLAAVTAALPLGPVALNERLGHALLASGSGLRPGWVTFADGRLVACSGALVDPATLDAGVLSWLLREAWAAAAAFAGAAGLVGAPGQVARAPLPRVLERSETRRWRPVDEWRAAHDALLAAGFHPLVDAPHALQAPTEGNGTLRVGPVRLGEGDGAPWTVRVERLVLAGAAAAEPSAWARLATLNELGSPVRAALVPEAGHAAEPALMLVLDLLPLSTADTRTTLRGVLRRIDEALPHARTRTRRELRGHPGRADLPWPPDRPWDGPGRGPALGGLAREVDLLPAGIPAPVELPFRVQAQERKLGRAGAGFLAHQALARAEATGPQSDWVEVARELVEPIAAEPSKAEPTVAGSLHVRLARLQGRPPALPPDDPAAALGGHEPPAPPRRWL